MKASYKASVAVGPLTLIALGVFFLINNLVVDIPFWRLMFRYWPFVLIVVGLSMLPRVIFGAPGERWGALTAGLIQITLGGLFALQNLADVPFSRTWPALLILVGVLGLLRMVFAPVLFASRVHRFWRGGFR